ncbi:MAG: cytochrome-c oxidase, cbb3-type subunit II [Gammaproteobacteria bacterium]|nr:cytochrome-c oxidase, cbb3-type subunit II [Gammaproteobacteria bacterium]
MKHERIETNAGLLIVLTLIVISIGGLVEIVPLSFIKGTVEEVKTAKGYDAIRPYTPLELRGRDIYQREGCYLCHSQMIRPFRDEMLRYGHYSLAAESQYDHPFQWGSKRTGPDLARVGGKYSNAWHVQHLTAPRSVVPESIMPNYPWLEKTTLKYEDIGERMRALREVGVPYSETKAEYDANVKRFGPKVAKLLDINHASDNLIAQAEAGNYDGDRSRITEMDALVAYLQVLGTMVDFSKYDEGYFAKFR